MKNLIIGGVILLAVGVLAPQLVEAQGTTYLSSLGQPSAGSLAVGNDSWLATEFFTGDNIGGYVLDFIQLEMADASGDPSDFRVMLYGEDPDYIFGSRPGSSLGTLQGSLSPVSGGIYTYTPAANITLSPGTPYFIVLTAGTEVADGAYEWDFTNTSIYNPGEDWILSIATGSNDGSSWRSIPGTFSQFAINATPVPEPSVLSLLGFGGLVLIWQRRKANAV